MNIILIYFAIKYHGDWDLIYKALEDKEKVSFEDIECTEQYYAKSPLKIITIVDQEYPNQLKQAYMCCFIKIE